MKEINTLTLLVGLMCMYAHHISICKVYGLKPCRCTEMTLIGDYEPLGEGVERFPGESMGFLYSTVLYCHH